MGSARNRVEVGFSYICHSLLGPLWQLAKVVAKVIMQPLCLASPVLQRQQLQKKWWENIGPLQQCRKTAVKVDMQLLCFASPASRQQQFEEK